MADKPYYNGTSIAYIKSLAETLGINEEILVSISNNISSSYTSFVITCRNKSREVVEPKYYLKTIQKRIVSRIMNNVVYPHYLMGGIRDKVVRRDYINNASIHLKKNTLINLDVKNFFPSINRNDVKNIYKKFFRFSEEVSEILTLLTTLVDGSLPQGGCVSTYLANLLFFGKEYSVVSRLRTKKIHYSRLLDDITLSSEKNLNNNEKTAAISLINGLVKKYGLLLHEGKTSIEHRKDKSNKYEVTGAWVRFGVLKVRKKERKNIRASVKKCEIEYANSPFDDDYHILWNRVSGKVSKLRRFGHKNEAEKLRKRLGKILPLYDEVRENCIKIHVAKILNLKVSGRNPQEKIKIRKNVLKVYYHLGILSRTNKNLSFLLRCKIRSKFGNIVSDSYY